MVENIKLLIPENINWDSLKRFLICVESKNFKDATIKIGTSPAVLGRTLDLLEKELKVELFERVNKNRTHKLTHQGKNYYDFVKRIRDHIQGLAFLSNQNTLSHEDLIHDEQLNIATTPGLASIVFPSIITNYHIKYPKIFIDVKAEVATRKIDYGEVMIRGDFKIQRDIKRILLFSVQMNLYASREYIKTFGKPRSLDELGKHNNLVLGLHDFSNTNWATVHIGKFNKKPIITSNSINFLYEICKSGQGILELPDIFKGKEGLEKIFDDSNAPKMDIYLACHNDTYHNPKVKNLIELFKNLDWYSL